jgi:tetratricopeptide (TPR) repeat protein
MKKPGTFFTSFFHFFIFIFVAGFVLSCQHPVPKSSTTAGDTTKVKPSEPVQSAENNSVTTTPNTPAAGNPDANSNKVPARIIKDKNGGYILSMSNKRDPNLPSNKMLNNFTNNSITRMMPSAKMTDDPEKRQAQELYLSGSEKSLKGDQQGAIVDYTESLTHFKMALTYMKRGYCELLIKSYDSAVTDMNETIKLDPEQKRAYFGRGICRFETQKFKDAADDFEKYIAKDRTTAMAFNYLAGCKFMLEDYKSALENYDMVVKLDPKFPDIYTNRGMMRHYQNDLKGAVEDYDKALTIDPKNATAYNNRGGAKLNEDNPKGALEDFNKAISLKEDYADAYVNRGKAKSNLGDKAGACEDWQKAYKLGLEEARDLIIKHCNKK